ncbi:unnamed protein product [Candidula unifasciata]|uniref:Uracil-DNA glycosylase n=1 Tax=Candidula unifasciata TaxID=100452 RepID=A0A8S3Z161_9EUPU|nr:unnamed protein product [Candidula unifasciata]
MSSPQSDEYLRKSVQETGVHEGWVSIFQDDLLYYFNRSIANVEGNLLNREGMVPEKSKILLALSRCAPEDIKVVILGHEPISNKNLATGFAFSFPEGEIIDENVGQRELKPEEGFSVKMLHDVLADAGYLERGATYDCCHEVWADRGVLLLNASLTYSMGHFSLWKKFVSRLLCLLVQLNRSQRLFFLCWGTNAKEISEWLLAKLWEIGIGTQAIKHDQHNTWVENSAPVVVFVGDHPTYPRDKNEFVQQAKIQFHAIKQWYPDLFTLEKHIPALAPDTERQNRTREEEEEKRSSRPEPYLSAQ